MRSLLVVALAALTGCGTYAYPLSTDDAGSRQRVTERAAGQDVVVRVQGQPGVQARALSVRADSTTWTDPATGAARAVATDQLRGVTIPGADGGVLRTTLVGIGGGLLTGAAVGALSYELPHGPINSRADAATFGAASAALVGGLVGLTMARDRQSDDVFIARHRPEPAPPQVASSEPAGHE